MLEICSRCDNKTPFYFVPGYRDDIDTSKMVSSRHRNTTCYSKINRYPKQTEHIKGLMAGKTDGPLKVLNIGVAQGQEPLTHMNTAFELAKSSGKKISDFLDITTVDILREPPQIAYQASALPKDVVSHLRQVYSPSSGKSFWGMPIENVAERLLNAGKKQDVVLFNNVIQHMSPKNESALPKIFEKLVEMVAPKGTFCFSCDRLFLPHPDVIPFARTKNLLGILKSRGFFKIATGIFMRRV